MTRPLSPCRDDRFKTTDPSAVVIIKEGETTPTLSSSRPATDHDLKKARERRFTWEADDIMITKQGSTSRTARRSNKKGRP